METAKVFMNGRSQAVRLPRDCRFGTSEVYVKRVGEMVVLVPKSRAWDVFMSGLEGFSADYLEDRRQPGVQQRDGL